MLPPFCCPPSMDMAGMKRQHQQRKHAMLSMWRDGVERQLSALNAAIDTLEQQMNRTSNQANWSEFKRSRRAASARFSQRWIVTAETPSFLPAVLRLAPSITTKRTMSCSSWDKPLTASCIWSYCSLLSIASHQIFDPVNTLHWVPPI